MKTRQPGRITHIGLPTPAALGQALAEAILASVNRLGTLKAANNPLSTQALPEAYTQLAGK